MTSSARYGAGSSSGGGPDISHPLRPYYDPDTFNAGYSVTFKQGVGLIDSDTNKPLTPSLTSSIIEQSVNENTGIIKNVSGGGYNPGLGIHGNRRFGNTSSILSGGNNGDKNYIYDLEFQEYFDMNNLSELFKNLLWNFLKNYCKVLLSQPLEIVRLVLQVGQFEFPDSTKKPKRSEQSHEKRLLTDSETLTLTENEELSDYEINYFQSPSDNLYNSTSKFEPNSPAKVTSSPKKKRAHKTNAKRKRTNKIQPLSMHSIDIMSAIVGKDGPFALFKGINASFIHQTLSHTIEAWITGFISPFLGIPDPFFLDLTHSNDPLRSLWLSVSACVLTGLILMPLDIIKIRLMITQFSKPLLEDNNNNSNKEESTGFTSSESSVHNLANSTLNVNANVTNQYVSTRSVRESIRNFPIQYLIHPPSSIVLLTIFHQFSTSIFRKTAPYILLIRFNIDSYSSPNIYTIINLISLIMEFFIKLPVENLLRKEQIRFLLKPKSLSEDPYRVLTIDNPDENLIIEFNSTWADAIDNGYDSDHEGGDMNEDKKQQQNKLSYWGTLQSLGLFNGWRVGVLNVIGFWGYNIFKNNGTELREERL